MKKLISALMIMICAILCAPQQTAAATPSRQQVHNVARALPQQFTVKQTATFNDGTSAVLYYRRNGANLEVYTNADVNKYSLNDLLSLKKSEFEVVSTADGRLVYTAPLTTVAKLLKRLANTYL